MAGLKEYHWGICWGHWQPSLERSLQGEVSTMGPLTSQTTHNEILALYQEVYQLKRDPGEVQCSENTVEETQIKILEILEECLQSRWGPTQPERETRWDTFMMPAQVEYHAQAQATYDYFGCHHRIQQESHEEALWIARDYHHQALATAAVFEGHIEQLSHSISWGQYGSQTWRQSCSHWWSGSWRCSRSHGHSRRHRRCLPARPQEWTCPVEGFPGDAARRWTDSPSLVQPRRQMDSPSPVWPKQQVTFKDTSLDSSPKMTLKSADWSCLVEGDHSPSPSSDSDETTETVDLTQPMEGDDHFSLSSNLDETVDWSQSAGGDLWDPPVLDPHVWEFLSRTESPGGRGDEPHWPAMPKLQFHDPQAWVRWHAHWEETPTWWPELVAVPQKGDIQAFERRIRASFHMPKACYYTTEGCNDYTVPPTLHCIKCDNHLPPPDPRFSTQDFHLKQPEKALAYAKALQHWAEVAKPPQLGEPCQLAECVKELRRCMRPLTTFTEKQVLSEDPPWLWVLITPSWCPATVKEEAPEPRRERSSKCWRASPQGSFLTPPSLGCCRHLIVPATTTLHSHYPKQAVWHTRYFHAVGENAPGKPCCPKSNVPAQICGYS